MFGVQIDLSETTIRFKGSHLHIPEKLAKSETPVASPVSPEVGNSIS